VFFCLGSGCEMGSFASEQVVKWVLLPQNGLWNGFFCLRTGCEMGSPASERVVKWVLLPRSRLWKAFFCLRTGCEMGFFFCLRTGCEMGSFASEQVVKWALLPQNRLWNGFFCLRRGCEMGFSASEQEQVAGCCEYGNEPSGFIKDQDFLDCLTGPVLRICKTRCSSGPHYQVFYPAFKPARA
jgi:hypothetical protein